MNKFWLALYLTTVCSLICSTTATSQWVLSSGTSDEQFFAFASIDSVLFAGGNNGGHRSTDNGQSWEAIDSGFVKGGSYYYPSINTFAVSGSHLYAGTETGVFVSSNDGLSWAATPLAPFYHDAVSILRNGPLLFAAGLAGIDLGGGWVSTVGDLFLSTDDGASWSSSSKGMPADRIVTSLVGLGGTLFAGTYFGIYSSADSGKNWHICDVAHYQINSIIATNTILIAACEYGPILLSADTGKTWSTTRTDSTLSFVQSVALTGTALLAGTSFDGVFLSRDNGTHWLAMNEGLGSYPASSRQICNLAIIGDFLFAGTCSGIWRRPISQITTNVAGDPNQQRGGFALEQNFPNPFNPMTEISFQIPSANHTTLEIYDILGRRVSTLISRYLQAGSYTWKWDASGLPSGVYLYRVSSGLYSATKKSIVAK